MRAEIGGHRQEQHLGDAAMLVGDRRIGCGLMNADAHRPAAQQIALGNAKRRIGLTQSAEVHHRRQPLCRSLLRRPKIALDRLRAQHPVIGLGERCESQFERGLVSSLNAASPQLPQPTAAEISSFRIQGDGTLAATPAGTGMSTQLGNAAGRHLPNAIGIETWAAGGRQFAIAAEARTVSSTGVPSATFAALQTASVSTWEIAADGSLLPRSQDFMLGPTTASGPTQAGFLVYSPIYSTFWVATSAGATISGYGLDADGNVTLGAMAGILARGTAVDPAATSPLANADGYVDMAISADGRWIYQLVGLKGRIDVYEVDTLVAVNIARRQQVTTGLLPIDNLQGLASVGS